MPVSTHKSKRSGERRHRSSTRRTVTSPRVKYHPAGSAASLPLVLPQQSRCHAVMSMLRNCVILRCRCWVRFVLLLGDPLVTCQALFGGLLLIGGTLVTSLSYLPPRGAFSGAALAETMGTVRTLGPFIIGLGAVFLAMSVVNHRILLRRDRKRQAARLKEKLREGHDVATCPPSVRRWRKVHCAGRTVPGGKRPPEVVSAVPVHKAAALSVDVEKTQEEETPCLGPAGDSSTLS